MTYEEMLAIAEAVKMALFKELRTNVEVLPCEPGEPIVIAFDHDGDDFFLELTPA